MILSVIILSISGQENEEMAECHGIEINQQELEQMNMKEQEEYVN